MSLRDRRRTLLGAGPQVAVPEGYIRNGLVFFLDARQLASPASWTDIVGGKRFSLTNCTLAPNGSGIVFDGTAYGEYPGPITSNAADETIEVVLSNFTDFRSLKTCTVLCQPMIDGSLGISCRFGDGGNYALRIAVCLDGVKHAIPVWASQLTTPVCISASLSQHVGNKNLLALNDNSSYSANNTGATHLGCHKFTAAGRRGGLLKATLLAVRIYNRTLSQAERIANQQNDERYYGITLT